MSVGSGPRPQPSRADAEPIAANPSAAATGAKPAASAPDRAVRRRQPPREVVRRYPCPECHAGHDEPCRGRRGPRRSHHFARVELAVEARYGQRLVLPWRSLPDGGGRGPKSPRRQARETAPAVDFDPEAAVTVQGLQVSDPAG